jgi:hypothetical protein
MSTDFRLLKRILASDLLDGRLEAFGVRERVALDHESVLARTPETYRCLTDGHNYVWFGVNDDGCVGWITRYGDNDPNQILDAVARANGAEIVSEHEPQFWGLETEEELAEFPFGRPGWIKESPEKLVPIPVEAFTRVGPRVHEDDEIPF